MKWIKKGLIYVADGKFPWARSHAMIPTPYMISNNILRIYLGLCDDKGRSRIGFIDTVPDNPSVILNISKEPVMDLGLDGTFDDNGVNPTSIVNCLNKSYLYYFGYQLGVNVRYYLFGGLAISEDEGNSFVRYVNVPIIDRSDKELYLRSAPFVMIDNNIWKMWYVGGSNWIETQNKILPSYKIKYLESKDGLNWGKEGKICIDFKNDDEHGFGRPWVIKENNVYKMFYSIRSKSKGYRLGYAESYDGLYWVRKDEEIGIDVSKNGWDSQMICYSSILKYKDNLYMFYNGNDYGRSGFGYAILESW